MTRIFGPVVNIWYGPTRDTLTRLQFYILLHDVLGTENWSAWIFSSPAAAKSPKKAAARKGKKAGERLVCFLPVTHTCLACCLSTDLSISLGSIIFPHANIHRPTVPGDLKQKLRGPGDPEHGVWDKWHGTLTQIWCELAGVCLSCTMGCSWSHSVANHQICHLLPSSQVDMPKGVIVFV